MRRVVLGMELVGLLLTRIHLWCMLALVLLREPLE